MVKPRPVEVQQFMQTGSHYAAPIWPGTVYTRQALNSKIHLSLSSRCWN